LKLAGNGFGKVAYLTLVIEMSYLKRNLISQQDLVISAVSMKYLTVEEERFVLMPVSLWPVLPPGLILPYEPPPTAADNQLLSGAQMFLPQLLACFPTCKQREIFKYLKIKNLFYTKI
jgi:hypothetical protein